MKDLEDEADRLLEKLQPIKKLQDNLRRNISQIKELINQARKQANSVSCQDADMYDCQPDHISGWHLSTYLLCLIKCMATQTTKIWFLIFA